MPRMMAADESASRAPRIGIAMAVALLHVLAVMALIRAFAPDLAGSLARDVGEALTVRITAPEPTPTPPPPAPEPSLAPDPAGAAAPEGKRANPREVSAPRPPVALATRTAPPVPATGAADSAGAADQGAGTGAGGTGQGTGAGHAGSGTGGGGGAVTKAVKIAGDINSARDYPRASRDLRLGDFVIVALTVGTDGRVSDCRVRRPSRDAEADAITCRLASQRFRFRPATDAAGRPVESVFGWQQRWFVPARE